MTKLMVFVDGSWLYHSKYKLNDAAGSEDYALDYGKLPSVVSAQLARQLPGRQVDVVRTCLFGSCASNHDSRDDEMVQRQIDFFSMLKEKYHYDVSIFPLDFRGRRLRRVDRSPDDHFEPRERGVNTALTASLLYHAAIPHAYDVAVVVIGESDYVTALDAVRRLGKRVAIVSIKATCSRELTESAGGPQIKDFDIIWLDEHVDSLELVTHRTRQRSSTSSSSGMDASASTGAYYYNSQDWSPSQIDDADDDSDGYPGGSAYGEPSASRGEELPGVVKTKFDDRGYGFVRGLDGHDYFFHITDLEPGLEFHDMLDGLAIMFQVKKEPEFEKAGAAQRVRLPYPGEVEDYQAEEEQPANV